MREKLLKGIVFTVFIILMGLFVAYKSGVFGSVKTTKINSDTINTETTASDNINKDDTSQVNSEDTVKAIETKHNSAELSTEKSSKEFDLSKSEIFPSSKSAIIIDDLNLNEEIEETNKNSQQQSSMNKVIAYDSLKNKKQ